MTTQETIDQAARIIAELQWPTPHSSAHIAQVLADADLFKDHDQDECEYMTGYHDGVSCAESVARMTPCTCSAQRARADEAEERVRELEAERNMALGRVDEYRQRLWRARADIEYICTTVGCYVTDTAPQERHAYAQSCGAQLRHDPGARFEVIDSVTRMLNGEQRGGFTTLNVTEATE